MKSNILDIYKKLLNAYGPQGWWPLLELNNKTKINITKSGSIKGYHPNDYSYPKTNAQTFEIIIGAILTQNTSWLSVEKAVNNLKEINALSAENILKINKEKIQRAIKPAGYFNQKTEYLLNAAKFFVSLNGKTPTREEILKVKGIGNETADSILLYAYSQPEFVVDAYTKRIFTHLKLTTESASYHDINQLFESSLPKDYVIFQEYHALIVEHAKRYYSKKPYVDRLINK